MNPPKTGAIFSTRFDLYSESARIKYVFKSFEWSYHTDRHQYYNDFSTRNDLYAYIVYKKTIFEIAFGNFSNKSQNYF